MQFYWEAKFATPESTLTEPHYRDENFKFCEIFYTQVFGKTLKKSQKNVISQKLPGFEQSNLAAKFLTPEIKLTKPHHRDANIKF